jgi:hypothetical protein
MADAAPWLVLRWRLRRLGCALLRLAGYLALALVIGTPLLIERFLPTMSFLEGVWLSMALFGLCYAARNLRDARGDLRLITRNGWNGGRRIIARGAVRREWERVIKLLCCFALGVQASLNPVNPVNREHPFRAAIGALLLLTLELVMATGSYWDRRARLRLLDTLLDTLPDPPAVPPAPATTAPQTQEAPP